MQEQKKSYFEGLDGAMNMAMLALIFMCMSIIDLCSEPWHIKRAMYYGAYRVMLSPLEQFSIFLSMFLLCIVPTLLAASKKCKKEILQGETSFAQGITFYHYHLIKFFYVYNKLVFALLFIGFVYSFPEDFSMAGVFGIAFIMAFFCVFTYIMNTLSLMLSSILLYPVSPPSYQNLWDVISRHMAIHKHLAGLVKEDMQYIRKALGYKDARSFTEKCKNTFLSLGVDIKNFFIKNKESIWKTLFYSFAHLAIVFFLVGGVIWALFRIMT